MSKFRRWFKRSLGESARDIAMHGADAGYPHITYTSDCVKVFDRYADEIWAMAAQSAEECGVNTAEFISGFRRSDMLDDWDCFKNLMLWFACEVVAVEMQNDQKN